MTFTSSLSCASFDAAASTGAMATFLCNEHGGEWLVRVLEANAPAIAFWRSGISSYSLGSSRGAARRQWVALEILPICLESVLVPEPPRAFGGVFRRCKSSPDLSHIAPGAGVRLSRRLGLFDKGHIVGSLPAPRPPLKYWLLPHGPEDCGTTSLGVGLAAEDNSELLINDPFQGRAQAFRVRDDLAPAWPVQNDDWPSETHGPIR